MVEKEKRKACVTREANEAIEISEKRTREKRFAAILEFATLIEF